MIAQTHFLERISENHGVAIAVTGMLIVFAVLVLISAFIAALPKALERLGPLLPPETVRHGHAPPAPLQTPQRTPEPRDKHVDEQLVAAIGVALHRKQAQ